MFSRVKKNMRRKKREFLPVPKTAGMEFRKEPSIPKVKDFQIPSSWAPVTPEKHILPKTRLIYEEREDNQLGHENWCVKERSPTGFSQETQAHGIEGRCDSFNSIDTTKSCEHWEAGLTWKSRLSGKFSIDSDRLTRATLRAFEHAALSTHSANQDISFGLNLWNNSSKATDTALYGNSITSQPTHALNPPAGALTDAIPSKNISSQFEPVTPDQSKKAENKLACDNHNLSMAEITNRERDKQENEVPITRVEVNELQHEKEQQLPKDLLSTSVPTQLAENHNPDKGSNSGIDLNRTPQQKRRRKKHRPKVVIEGQLKRTPKPVTPMSARPKENPTGKRKKVQKGRLEKPSDTPTTEVTSRSTDPKISPHAEQSCRRTLNFDIESQAREARFSWRSESKVNAESQAQNFCTRFESKSNVQLGQGMGIIVEKISVDMPYNLRRSMTKVLEDYTTMPERQGPSPPTPTKTGQPHEMKAQAQNEHTRQKCRIVFSNGTRDKQGNTRKMMNSEFQSATRSPSDSNCSSSACLTEEEQVRGLKRNSCTINEAELSRTNMLGGHFNSLHEYQEMLPTNIYNNQIIPGMHFPAIYKKKRTEKVQVHSSTKSSSLPITTVDENNVRKATLCPLNDACEGPQGNEQAFECKLALDQKGWTTKKRSKGSTRARSFASLKGILECKPLPAFPAQRGKITLVLKKKRGKITGDMQVHEILPRPLTCVEALVAGTHATITTKKRTKRNSYASSVTTDATQKRISHIDAIIERMKGLNINLESIQVTCEDQGVLVPYKLRYEEKNALVLYQRDGTIVPFEGPFNQVRKRRPRPKVDLDEETSRVWKLLLESINNEGIDGTDEEKAKWWEEERRVFRGRADSFIARMHLIQGDRRFSPWKGSVVDSVIGVFLTQNVSDHLSSSAFMSLAAQFPLKSKSNDMPCFEETSICVKEPEVCVLDPDDTIKWHEKKSNQPARNGTLMTLHDMNCSVEKEVITGYEFPGSSRGSVKSTDNLKFESPNNFGNGLEIYNKAAADGAEIQVTETLESHIGDRTEWDDVVSSQNSAGSSQNYVDSSMAQTAERMGSFLLDNSEVYPETMSNPNSVFRSSFVELLQRAETLPGLQNREIGNASFYKENEHTYMEGSEFHTHNRNEDRSDNPGNSLRHIIPANKKSMLSHISKKNKGNCRSEHSGVTTESVNQAMEKITTLSFQKTLRSPNENNHSCSSLQGEMNTILQTRNRSVGDTNDNIQSVTYDQNHRTQQVLEAPNLSGETLNVIESTSAVSNPKSTEHNTFESSLKDHEYLHGKAINGIGSDTTKAKRQRIVKQKQDAVEWDSLRMQAQAKGKRDRTTNTMDSLDYEAVRCAEVHEIADTIKERGMNNVLAERIKDFLNRLVREHGSIDLEWLRDVPPDKAKEYLLSVRGLGLKSVECVRLLTLHHLAFPVDTNVGRIAVRLGWVPLQPLPESLQLHLLELYPVLESIQRYLWPRLCKLDQRALYELHYQMITFGKVFCTKSKPNCNACPMRGECRHFASAFASARLSLPGPEEKSIVSATENKGANRIPVDAIKPLQLPLPQANQQLQALSQVNHREPFIEVPTTPKPTVELPATPDHEQPQVSYSDIEDGIGEDPEEIPTIKLNIEELTQNLQTYMQQNMEIQEANMSKALVALTPEAASIPMPKLKNVNRLRTEHRVYELPDSHPLLEGLQKREPDDPCSYLLAIWTPGETANSIQLPERKCSFQEFEKLCGEKTCFSCSSIQEANSQTVRGTLLIPCRTAMRGSFPLNGTYFQVNETMNPALTQLTYQGLGFGICQDAQCILEPLYQQYLKVCQRKVFNTAFGEVLFASEDLTIRQGHLVLSWRDYTFQLANYRGQKVRQMRNENNALIVIASSHLQSHSC